MTALRTWLPLAGIVVGLLALSALVWIAGPLLAVADVRPLETGWSRALVIGVFVAIAAGLAVLDWRRRRQASAAIEAAMAASEEAEGDTPVLRDAIKDAIATLRRSKTKGGDPLYDLPWYIIIGPPGAGKTTALVNSGLRFPLARDGAPHAVAGVGGTRYCDWWFTDEAVLLDTAGRYTTQDSDPGGDRKSWLALLGLLRENRPRQPINGVIVAISIEDLLTCTPEEIEAHATAIRKRLAELHDQLKIAFPVYALFTKADLVAGFTEFFGGLAEFERQRVWGHTFQTADRTRNMMGEVPAEFDALVERLNEQLADRLQNEPSPPGRVTLFGFPSQVASLKRPVVDFLNRIFEPSRYQTNATLRGFYFTSGTQQGTPIDRLIGTLARNFGAEAAPVAAFSGRGKSYFLTDLLQKVVIGEAGWVSTNRAAVRRTVIIRAAAFSVMALLSLGALATWLVSYNRNRELITSTSTSLAEYRTLATPVLVETTVSDRNFGKVLPLLHKLRHMPAGFAVRDIPEPMLAGFGLSQRDRVQSASETAYQVALERVFRSRLIYRLEELLEGNITNRAFVYDALKAYLMLGGRGPVDRDFVVSFMGNDWAQNLFPGAANARGRQALEEHLDALLDLEAGREPTFSLNQALIDDAQRTLARMSIAERAYELLKSQARGASQRDWIVGQRGGLDVALVFEGSRGEDLQSIRVPFFHTYDGFQFAFMDRLAGIGALVDRERWVLGQAGQQAAVEQQYATLYGDLLKLYTRDFVEAWQQALRRLKLRPLTADKPRYVALSAAAASTSPIKQLLESVRDETRLTRERPPRPAGTPDPLQDAAKKVATQVGRDVATEVARNAASRVASRAGVSVPTIAPQPGAPTPPSPGSFFGATGEAPGAGIEAQFRAFQIVVDGEGGRRPIDALLQTLTEISQSLAIANTNPAQQMAANNALIQQVATLRATASRFPAPFDAMIRTAANDFEGDASGATVVNLQAALADQVTRICQQIVTNRYPFVRGSEREVALADFARLFAPSGIMDKFFTQNLAQYVDQSRLPWSWKPDSRVARSLSTVTLRQFQQALEIRDAFFPTGGNMPSFSMTITPQTLGGDASTGRFEINGTQVNSQQGVNAPSPVQWPGGIPRSSITIGGGSSGGGFFGGGFFSQPATVQRDGVWSFFRLLDSGTVLKQGDALIASFNVGGREVSYQINVGSIMNPLQLPALREFRCPAGL